MTTVTNNRRRLAAEAVAALGLEPRLVRLIAAVHEAGHAIAGATVGFDITAARAGTVEAADANQVAADFGAGQDVPLASVLTWKAAGYQASFTWLQGRGIDGAQPPYDFALNTLAADDIRTSRAACRRAGMPHLTMQHGIEGAAWILTHRWRAVLRLAYALARGGALRGDDLVPYLAADFPQYLAAVRAYQSWKQKTGDLWLRGAASAVLPASGGPAAGEAAGLPPRVAHVLHALMTRWADRGEAVTAAEVCEYDSEALTVRHTVAGLVQARRLGLADNLAPGLWGATGRAWAMRADIEQRFRAEVPGA